jgi:hypothetical protein
LRQDAFETRFKLEPSHTANGEPRSFGLIHEFWQGGVVVTMAAFNTGDLSLYFSSGGGILGGIQHERVAEMVRKTIPLLGPLTPQLERSDEMERPGAGEVTFTVLTTDGRYRSRLKAMPERNLKDANFQLFALSQGLIGELRKASESQAP